MKQMLHSESGYIALIAVIIILAATLAIGLSLNVLSIGEAQSGLLRQQSVQAFGVADSCMQEAYIRIKRDGAYAGGSLNLGEGSCTITVTSNGSDRTVTVASDVDGIQRSLESKVTIVGATLSFQYWTEAAP